MGQAGVLKTPPARNHSLSPFSLLMQAAEHGRLPDSVVRFGIRRLLRQRLRAIEAEAGNDHVHRFISATLEQPIAVVPEIANHQHYEVPAEFFRHVLGPAMKYSSCYWPAGINSLPEAEFEALRLTCQNADICDGMNILELGCGWGSLSLWMAENFPNCRITSVSNSQSQRRFIEARIAERGLQNLHVVTADMNDFRPAARFDRVVSVEMFEHMRNHRELMTRIHHWLRPGGRLLVHNFCHRSTPYLFESDGEQNWMGQHFFRGGMMPAVDSLQRCGSPLRFVEQATWNGMHYARTCRAWLANQDAAAERLIDVLSRTYGRSGVTQWHQRWRMFFMACEELFAFNNGEEWFVSHTLFERPEDE